MKLKKTLLAVAAAVLAGSAYAAPVTVAGVTWDPDSFFDLTSTSTLFETPVLNAGEELKGYGVITTINNLGNFMAAGSELTYVFSGYTLQSNVSPTLGSPFAFSNGEFRFYADSAANATPGSVASYTDGVLWLTLAGVDAVGAGFTLGGTLTQPTASGIAGQGVGYLDVVLNGSAAQDYFDTNGQFGADVSFTSSFQPNPGGTLPDGNTHFGTANIAGNTKGMNVPEPGALALLGLGFAAMGFARRNAKRG